MPTGRLASVREGSYEALRQDLAREGSYEALRQDWPASTGDRQPGGVGARGRPARRRPLDPRDPAQQHRGHRPAHLGARLRRAGLRLVPRDRLGRRRPASVTAAGSPLARCRLTPTATVEAPFAAFSRDLNVDRTSQGISESCDGYADESYRSAVLVVDRRRR